MDSATARSAENPSHVTGRLVRREELGCAEREAMHGLLSSYFDGVEREVFDRDLDEKEWVILLEHNGGELVGFTTLLLYRTDFEDETITVVFSGDTIVDQASWGTAALHRTWIEAVTRLAEELGEGRLFWQLIVSGFRTYRLLPVFFREFYPRHDAETPERMQALMHELASHRFDRQYDASRGIVRFSEGAHRLATDVGGAPPTRMQNPHVRFFVEHNSGHQGGDELVCITEIHADNLTRAGNRMVRRRP